jgi:hypothetical protein
MRPLIPIGRGGLLVLAVAAIPLVISKCKPVAKQVGDKLVEWGEKLKKDADRTDTTEASSTSSKADMQEPTVEETLKSASPAGKEEVKTQSAAKNAGAKAPPKAKPAATKKTAPKAKPGAATNPKKPTKGS